MDASIAPVGKTKEEQDFESCAKLAALAGIRLPVLGDHYCTMNEEALVYQAADLSTIARKKEPGKIFGPIVDYCSYEETQEISPMCSELRVGILVAFNDEAVDKTSGLSYSYRAYIKLTRDREQLCAPSSGPVKSFWDDAPPTEMSTNPADAVEDAPLTATQMIAQLRSAGVSLREETPGVVLSTRRRDFPGQRREAPHTRRVRRFQATVDPYMAKEKEEGPKEDPLGPLMQNLREMQAEEESAKVEGKPKKRAKNTISSAPEPSTTSRQETKKKHRLHRMAPTKKNYF